MLEFINTNNSVIKLVYLNVVQQRKIYKRISIEVNFKDSTEFSM